MREASILRVFNFDAIFAVGGRTAQRKSPPIPGSGHDIDVPEGEGRAIICPATFCRLVRWRNGLLLVEIDTVILYSGIMGIWGGGGRNYLHTR